MNNSEPDFPDDEDKNFSDWLRTERDRKGLTREALAKLTELSTQAIYQIESGRVRNPWRQTRERLMRALGQTSLPTAVQANIDEETEIEAGEEFNEFLPWSESSIPQSQCVYVYYDRSGRPIYVGETQNLRARNKQHQQNDKWFLRNLIEKGAYVSTESVAERKKLEKLLLLFLRQNFIFNRKSTFKGEQTSHGY